jgi:hypothetical protein
MSYELNHPGSAVAAFLLSFSTVLARERNGTLADYEMTEFVEEALTKLETHDAGPSLQSQDAWRFARELLEQLHARHSGDRSGLNLDFPNH